VRQHRSWIVLFAVAAEAALLYWVWASFGMVVLASILIAGFMLGILVMRIAGLQAFRAMTDAQQRAAAFGVAGADGAEQLVHSARPDRAEVRQTAEELGKSSLLFVAGILLAVPGILTSAAGLVMLLPPVRAAMARRLARSMERSMQASARITVITADDSGVRAEDWSAGGAADPPPRAGEVIQGEILPPAPRDDH
jgi:UPF0716 protein FxsA